jgi:protein-disulfide isomerase
MGSSVEDDQEDLTRKQRREQAREQRRELEQAEAAGAVRRARLRQLGIVVGIVVAIIVVILIATGGGSKTAPPKPKTPAAEGLQAKVTALLAGIPQSGNTLGNPKAPVTLVYFGDLECPICREFTEGAQPALIQNYVRNGKLKIEYRSLETATKEPETFKTQQTAALAAGKQNKMWHFLELFYYEQGLEGSGYVTESYLQGLAQQVPGLNLPAWTAARAETQLMNILVSDAQAASNAGFSATPAFQLGKTGGTLQTLEYDSNSLKDPSSFSAAIEKLLHS